MTFVASKAQEQYLNEEYTSFLKEICHENLDIDYRQFRISYRSSEQFKTKETSEYNNLKQKVYQYIKKKKSTDIIEACKKMLKIDYTSMFAHKHIQQTAKSIGYSALHKKHHDIEFGLLKSIIHPNDGTSCETAWEVTQLEEEYFILEMLGVDFKKQELENFCNKVKVKNGDETYYFGVYNVFKNGK